VRAIGVDGARVRADQVIREAGWQHGGATLFLAFDADSTRLETIYTEVTDPRLWDSMKPAKLAPDLWDVEAVERKDKLELAQLPPEVTDSDVEKMTVLVKGQAGGKALFDEMEARFLAPTEKLRRVKGARSAMLRCLGVHLVVLETGLTWEARRMPGREQPQSEADVLARIRELLLPAKKGPP
jgi:hypothetical protein